MFLVHYQDCSPRQICLTETTFERDQKKLHEHFSVSYQTYVPKKNLKVHRIFLSHAKKYLFVKRNAYIPIKQNPYAIHEL